MTLQIHAAPGRLCPDDELCSRPARCEMGLRCGDVQELSREALELSVRNCDTCRHLQVVSYAKEPCLSCVGSNWEPEVDS